jgi:hypothetical protein
MWHATVVQHDSVFGGPVHPLFSVSCWSRKSAARCNELLGQDTSDSLVDRSKNLETQMNEHR